jgi:hypothetical protein
MTWSRRELVPGFLGGCVWAGLIAVATGCDDGSRKPDFLIGASASWPQQPASAAEVGYSIFILLVQRPEGERCRQAPASTELIVDDKVVALTRDPASGCIEGKVVLGPFLQDKSVAARVEEEAHVVAEVVFDGLAPGIGAKLAFPTDGRVRPGDVVVIVPPPTLPTSSPSLPTFYPLEAPVWEPRGVRASPGGAERRPDGIHVPVASFVGPAVLIVTGMPYVPRVFLECPGFFGCTANPDNVLGPIFLTGEP